MDTKALTAVAALLALVVTSHPAAGGVIFESAMAGGVGQSRSGISIGGTSHQIYGAAFTIAQGFDVDGIGGLLFAQGSPFPDDIFGAIVSLSSVDALPNGDPFTGPEVLASTVFHVGVTSAQDITVPLSVHLDPGAYGVLFGNDQFGAMGIATAPTAGAVLTTHYLVWNTDSGSIWEAGTGYSRFFVTGTATPVPEPSGAVLCGTGVFSILIGLCYKHRYKRSIHQVVTRSLGWRALLCISGLDGSP